MTNIILSGLYYMFNFICGIALVFCSLFLKENIIKINLFSYISLNILILYSIGCAIYGLLYGINPFIIFLFTPLYI